MYFKWSLCTLYLFTYQVRVTTGDWGICWFICVTFLGVGHVLLQFLCNLQQYCDSAYNKLNSHQQKEFINITKMNCIGKNRRERGRQTRRHACTQARTHPCMHACTHIHNSKLKFMQLNSPANRSTTILTKKYLHSMCMRTMYKC